MRRFLTHLLSAKRILGIVSLLFVTHTNAKESIPSSISLQSIPGFFRFSYDDPVSMPNGIPQMGLLGVDYFTKITPSLYAGFGAYGAVKGTQGGLFTLGIAGGWQQPLWGNVSGEIGFFTGGGGGRSSLVGGGWMIRPHVGLTYAWHSAKLGIYYSAIRFPNGKISSKQAGMALDIPTDFYYLPYRNDQGTVLTLTNVHLLNHLFLDFHRNDFGILLQAYYQRKGTKNTDKQIQDGTIGLVGAELDHYVTDHLFWYLKASGAYHGIPNGYMDVLGGVGYHLTLNQYGMALVPQMGVGAGGGGLVDSGGGVLINPQLGAELSLTRRLALRLSSGYLWSPQGQMHAVPFTALLLYHLNFAKGSQEKHAESIGDYEMQGWRIQALNQTYLHPQRHYGNVRSVINVIAIQIDQLFTPTFFFVYQGAAAYQGDHSGGYATGMIGPGIQTVPLFKDHVQLFAELLVGAGGGGNLALSGGSIIEPVLGCQVAFNNVIGFEFSLGQLIALKSHLNTPVVNAGLTIRFDTLNKL